MANQKAEAVVRRHLSDKSTDKSVGLDVVVVAADTIVVVDGVILGKPASRDEAFSMLKRLVSRRHDVMTAVAIADLAGRAPKWQRFVVTTHVEFGDVDDFGHILTRVNRWIRLGRMGFRAVRHHSCAVSKDRIRMSLGYPYTKR